MEGGVIMACKKHPKYEVKREPRADCDRCWLMWLRKEVERLSAGLRDVADRARGDSWL